MNPKTQAKIDKYYKEHPFFEKYKGWVIRRYLLKHPYFPDTWKYTCDVRVGVESIMSSCLKFVHEWIDKKISEGKVQREDKYYK